TFPRLHRRRSHGAARPAQPPRRQCAHRHRHRALLCPTGGGSRGPGLLMRAFLFTTVLVCGCAGEKTADDPCQSASARFERCGVTLPILMRGSCDGVALTIAQCVNQLASDCDQLSTLSGRLGECRAILEGTLPPLDDIPVPLPSSTGDG